MRKIMFAAAILGGLAGLGFAGTATAATPGLETVPARALVQPVQYRYYHHGYYHRHWVHYRHWHHRRWYHGRYW